MKNKKFQVNINFHNKIDLAFIQKSPKQNIYFFTLSFLDSVQKIYKCMNNFNNITYFL